MTAALETPPRPRRAWLLGLAGLLPFLAGALAPWLAGADHAPRLGFALAAYAATIAAFLGGVHWGPALQGGGRDTVALAWGVLPQLLAWGALMLPLRAGLLVLGLLLVLCYLVDRALYSRAGLGAWLPLRLTLTVGAVASLGLGAAAL